jgi:beta-xylosidase
MASRDRGHLPRRPRRVAVTVAAVAALTVTSTAASAADIHPVIARDFPDPAVLAVGSTYYAYSTASGYPTGVRHVPVEGSASLFGGWTELGDAMPQLPGWVAGDSSGSVWAPAVSARSDGSYLLYFTAHASAPVNVQCIGAALATSPIGPFHPVGNQPLVCHPQEVNSIDPDAFTDTDGSQYLLYSSGRGTATIWAQQMSRDGLTLIGDRRALIRADRPDEANIVEAPAMVHHGSEYVLFFSADAYNSGAYFINYATATSMTGPFQKAPKALLDATTLHGKFSNPGGQDIVPGTTHDYLIFHAYTAPNQRSMFVAELSWHNGTPTVQLEEQAHTNSPDASRADQLSGTGLPPNRRGARTATGP